MDDATQAIIRWGRYAAQVGLLSGKSGNLSARDAPDWMRVTASGTFLGDLAPDDVIRCRLDGAPQTDGARRPSMETDMHRLLYRRHAGAGAVFHASPFYATLLSCTREPIPLNLLPETMAYLRGAVRVPYHHPGSAELARATADLVGLGQVGILENHGLIVAAATVEEAVVILETFETLCRMLIVGRAAGLHLEVLPDAVRDDFLAHLGRLKSAPDNTRRTDMPTWKCADCGTTSEGRCRPAKCPRCGAARDTLVKA